MDKVTYVSRFGMERAAELADEAEHRASTSSASCPATRRTSPPSPASSTTAVADGLPRGEEATRKGGPCPCYTRLTMRYLDKISDPADLRQFSERELTLLADEVRETILSCVSETGGHLAAASGPWSSRWRCTACCRAEGPIVWDVGHQCYAHKLITDDVTGFGTIRQYGGSRGSQSGRVAARRGRYGPCLDIHQLRSRARGGRAHRPGERRQHRLRARRRRPHRRGRLRGAQSSGPPAHAARGRHHDNEMSIRANVGALQLYLNRIRWTRRSRACARTSSTASPRSRRSAARRTAWARTSRSR